MTEKIDWYREVLELEPDSRLFFPLARMLAAEGRAQEAMSYLKRGLERHPEFMEARLLYVELLHRAGEREECARQLSLVEAPLRGHAGFWEAWGRERSAGGDEAGWALTFLSAVFGERPVTLREVMERGLEALVRTGEKPAPQAEADAPAGQAHAAAPAAEAVPQAAAQPAVRPREKEPERVPLAAADSFAAVAAAVRADEAAPPAAPPEEATLRTRSMADVLAEQGDVRGALDIYLELQSMAVSPQARMELQQRIDGLTALLVEDVAAEAAGPDEQPETASGKDRLISMLEELAERVEARARGEARMPRERQ